MYEYQIYQHLILWGKCMKSKKWLYVACGWPMCNVPIIFQSAIPTNENSVGPLGAASCQPASLGLRHYSSYEIEWNRIVFRENRWTPAHRIHLNFTYLALLWRSPKPNQVIMGRSKRGGQGVQTPLKYHKNIGFPSNTLKNHKATIQCWAIIGMPAKCHFNGVSLADRWWPRLSPHQLKKTKQFSSYPNVIISIQIWFSYSIQS